MTRKLPEYDYDEAWAALTGDLPRRRRWRLIAAAVAVLVVLAMVLL